MHQHSYHRPLGRKLGLIRWASAVGASVALCATVVPATHAAAVTPSLGTAADFAAVAGTTITNTGPTVVNGDLGVSPGSAVVGFPPRTLNGTIYTNNAVAAQAAADHHTAYTAAAGQPCDETRSDPDLGGDTVSPGVICFTQTGVGLTGTLTLDAGGDPNAAWIFKTGSTLTTASNSAVVLVNGASPWQQRQHHLAGRQQRDPGLGHELRRQHPGQRVGDAQRRRHEHRRAVRPHRRGNSGQQPGLDLCGRRRVGRSRADQDPVGLRAGRRQHLRLGDGDRRSRPHGHRRLHALRPGRPELHDAAHHPDRDARRGHGRVGRRDRVSPRRVQLGRGLQRRRGERAGDVAVRQREGGRHGADADRSRVRSVR